MGLFSPSYDGLCSKGLKAMGRGNLNEAEDFFLKAMEKDPHQPLAFAGLGLTYQKVMGYMADGEDKEKNGEMSVKAFDEAIRLQTTPELRAEYWWQKAITLGLLKRTAEREQSWREADKIMPGFTVQRNDRSAWMDKRTCEICGKTFTLSDHGGPHEWAAAESLQRGTVDSDGANYFALANCPLHVKQAVLAVLKEAMEEQSKRTPPE